MQKRNLALSVALLIILGAGTAYAGDTVLYSPVLSSPVGGTLVCHATNVGKKPLARVHIRLFSSFGNREHICDDVPPVLSSGVLATCSEDLAGSAVCQITITGGSHKSVRAVMNVRDSNGGTILSVPATK